MGTKMTLALALTAGSIMTATLGAQVTGDREGPALRAAPAYTAAEYPVLSGIPGFSARLVADHIKLYQGYVKNTNILSEKLTTLLAAGSEKTPEYAELKRRFGWEFNGMRLHELYFENLGGAGAPGAENRAYKKIQDEFGSFDAWRKDFTATGTMRGVGWTVLYQDHVSGRLFNAWINEHDGGHLAGCTPLLVMDVFEHAYITDYALDRTRYIEAFMNAIDWARVEARRQK